MYSESAFTRALGPPPPPPPFQYDTHPFFTEQQQEICSFSAILESL